MSEFLEDPSVLTKDKLKSELLANNVSLPSGEHRKDVYVQLYLKTLTVQNKKKSGSPDTFSSDEELPPPVVSNKSRSGRKATRKTDKPPADELDVADLTDESLKEQLLKYGVRSGPIVASTRKLYEKKLQKLMEQGPPESAPPPTTPAKIGSNQNGNTDSDQYSDKEEEERAVPEPEPDPEPEPEPEPIPVVEKPVRSRGKTPQRTRRQEYNRVEERVAASEKLSGVGQKDLLKELFPNEPGTPTGISATCRRPIRGAAGRPLPASDFWLNESQRRSSTRIETSTYITESRAPVRAAALHLTSTSPFSSSSSSSAGVPSTSPARQRRSLPMWLQLLLLSVVAGFLFFVYQAMETNQASPFAGSKNLEGGGQ